MKHQKVLITGAQGQLGQVLQWQFSDHEVTALDIQDLNICQVESVRKALSQVRPHLVINAAAYTQVDDAETNQEAAYRSNALGPKNLALATQEANIPLVHFSTDYVFDGTQSRPYHEFDRPNPISVYGQSKLAGDEVVRSMNPKHFIVRTAWLYHTVGKNFPNTICRLADRDQVRVVSDQFGSPTYAPYLAHGVYRLVETDAYGTYHLAGSGEASWYELAQALYKALGIQTPVVPISTEEYPLPATRPAYAVLTSLQDPFFSLPPWQEGVRVFATQWKG